MAITDVGREWIYAKREVSHLFVELQVSFFLYMYKVETSYVNLHCADEMDWAEKRMVKVPHLVAENRNFSEVLG